MTGRGDALVKSERPVELRDIADWRAFLAQGIDDEAAERLRTHERKGLALGNDAFVAQVEAETGRNLRRRPRGRPLRREMVGSAILPFRPPRPSE